MLDLTAGFDKEIKKVDSELKRRERSRDAELKRLEKERNAELYSLQKQRDTLVEFREKLQALAPPPRPKRKYTKRSARWDKSSTKTKTKPKTTVKAKPKSRAKATTKRK